MCNDPMEWEAAVMSVKANRKRKIVTGLFSATDKDGEEEEKEADPTSHTMIRRCSSEFSLSKKRSTDSHKVKNVHPTGSFSSQGWRESTRITSKKKKRSSLLSAPLLKKINCTSPPAIDFTMTVDNRDPITNTTINENIVCARAKKKKKKKTKKREVLLTRTWEENTKENPSCYNDGISKQSLELFDNMVKAFRFTGNKRLEDPLDSCESHVSTANATFFSTFGTKPRTMRVRCQRRSTMTKEENMKNCYRRVDTDNAWVPPYSPYDLMQEDHSFDPWRVLVICMLLNQTTGGQVKKILRRVFLICPTAEAAVQAPEDDLRTIITSLGLQNKRVRDIREMSRQYLEDGWTHVTQLHGIGKYAADSYAIFCVGEPEDVVPNDHMLVKYWKFVVRWKREQQLIMDSADC